MLNYKGFFSCIGLVLSDIYFLLFFLKLKYSYAISPFLSSLQSLPNTPPCSLSTSWTLLSLIVINERYTKYKLLSLYNGNHIMFSGLFDDGSNMIILLIIWSYDQYAHPLERLFLHLKTYGLPPSTFCLLILAVFIHLRFRWSCWWGSVNSFWHS